MKSSSFNEYYDDREMWVRSGKRIKNRIKEIKIIHNGKEKALTQKGLVEKCNEVGNIPFHEQYISYWIHGEKPIDPQYWHALCTVLDCDPEWLICELPEDCRHIQHADAHERYGLSEEALMKLEQYSHTFFFGFLPDNTRNVLKHLDKLICNQSTLMAFLDLCNSYMYSYTPGLEDLKPYLSNDKSEHPRLPPQFLKWIGRGGIEPSTLFEDEFIKKLRKLFEGYKVIIEKVKD